jgi:type II secretory pathway pseudopilin PulG
MRKGFSLITALVVIVLMAGVTAMVFNTAGKIVKETTTQYRKEQAVLLAKSYTEYAILAIQGHDMAANGCLRTITGQVNSTQFNGVNAGANANGDGYTVTVRMYYIGLPPAVACPVVNDLDNANPSTNQDLSVLVDVNVRYRDPDQVAALLTNGGVATDAPWINYNRRTLQRL